MLGRLPEYFWLAAPCLQGILCLHMNNTDICNSTISMYKLKLKLIHFHIFQAPEYCSKHVSQTLSHFCETCDSAICPLCKVNTHIEHVTVPLAKKYKEMEKELKLVLKRLKSARNWQNIVNKSAEDAKNKIQYRYSDVVKSLNEICQQYKTEIDEARNKELTRFAAYADQHEHLEAIAGEINNVLETHSYTSSFIQQYEGLKEKVRSAEIENNWRRPVFKSPLENWGIFKHSKDILGYWENETIDQALNSQRKGNKNQRSFFESPYKPKRSKSLDNMVIRERSVNCGSSMSSLRSLSIDEEEVKEEISDTEYSSGLTDPPTVVRNLLIFFSCTTAVSQRIITLIKFFFL